MIKFTLKKHFTILSILIVLLFGISVFAENRKNVLILNSYHKGNHWSDRITEGVNSIIKDWKGYDFFYEYMDTKRTTDREYLQYLARIYKLKFKNTVFDLIMVSDDNGLRFCIKNHKSIFKNAPIVFCGINKFNDSMLAGHKNVTGVVEKYDPLDTLLAIRKIFPDIKNYISISDETVSGLINRSLLEDALRKLPHAINYIPWHNFTHGELVKKLKNAPGDSIIIFTEFYRDREGKLISSKINQDLINISPIPVFGRQDWMFNNNFLGGMIVSGFHQGSLMASLGWRVLNGENINRIPVIKESPNKYIFDYKVMEKYGISENDLPENSIILNSPQTLGEFYEINKTIVLSAGLIFMVLITILLTIGIVLIRKSHGEKEELIVELQKKLGQVNTLHGMLPICSNCKKIRNDDGYWEMVENYISDHSEAEFTHTLCSECFPKIYPGRKQKE